MPGRTVVTAGVAVMMTTMMAPTNAFVVPVTSFPQVCCSSRAVSRWHTRTAKMRPECDERIA